MNENEFEWEGKVYVAVCAPISDDGLVGCYGCSLERGELCAISRCCSWERKDNRNVIFIEKQGE